MLRQTHRTLSGRLASANRSADTLKHLRVRTNDLRSSIQRVDLLEHSGIPKNRRKAPQNGELTGVGMNSERLAARTKQPGHDRTFLESEANFVDAARACLDPERYLVEASPRDLRSIFVELAPDQKPLGVMPEASITSRATGRKFFVEVKKQGPAGNAHERAYKHHTVQFYKILRERFGWDYHPYVTIFCESLATLPRYAIQISGLVESDQYFLWKNYELEPLCAFLCTRCKAWLDD